MDAHPYSHDEQRVADWLNRRGQIGGGPDPIGFLLSSYELLVIQREHYADSLRTMARAAMDGSPLKVGADKALNSAP